MQVRYRAALHPVLNSRFSIFDSLFKFPFQFISTLYLLKIGFGPATLPPQRDACLPVGKRYHPDSYRERYIPYEILDFRFSILNLRLASYRF